MNKLGKSQKNTDVNIELKGEQRGLLPSSKVGTRCSSLDFINPKSKFVSEESAIEYLADILVDIFISQESNGK